MEILEKNTKLMERKHFLTRAVANGHMEAIQGEKEIAELEKQILENMQEYLNAAYDKLKTEVQEVKINARSDGDMKRGVAYYIRDMLRQLGFEDEEIKGVFRQGYKISRSN